MNEQQRRDYLQRMGFEVYYPRYRLPGAKPSPTYEIPAVSPREKPEAQQKPPQRQAALGKAAEPAKPSSEPLQPISTEKSEPKADRPGTTSQPAEELRFSLQFFAINENLAILSEEPHQLHGKQSRDSMTLLRAIIKAILPADTGEIELSAVELDWPIAEGLAAPDPRRAATLAVQGFINQRQEQDRFANLLIFSGQIHQLLVAQQGAESYGDQESDKLKSRLTVTHSLQSMLVHPLLKRDTWAHLQSLKKRLQG